MPPGERFPSLPDREALRALVREPLEALLDRADAARRERFGSRVSFCAIQSARTGRCGEDCAFCAQSAQHAAEVSTHALVSEEEVAEAAARAREAGACAFGIVTSGCRARDLGIDALARLIARVREAGLEPHASLGIVSSDELAALKAAGLVCYTHNLETSEGFYPRICATHAWRERFETARAVKAASLALCCGGLFGLGESWLDRIDLALALRELAPERVPVNFLVPVKGTPLAAQPVLEADEGLRIVALLCLALPESEIRVCGGRERVLGEQQAEAFRAGATGMILGDYLTTKGRPAAADMAMVRELGLTPVRPGASVKEGAS